MTNALIMNTGETITSLELLEQINIFRKEEGSRLTNHKDLLIIIETEFTDVNRKRVEGGVCPKSLALINQQLQEEGIQISSYTHPQNKQEYPLYILSTEQAKQCLIKESKVVRKAMVKYINELESKIKTPRTFIEAMQLATETLIKNEQLALENKVKSQQILEMRPKVNYHDLILQCTDLLTITLIAKDYGFSGKKMNELLHEYKVQYKQSGVWLLYEKYAEFGYTQTKTISFVKSDGESGAKVHTYWTQKGRLFLYDLLKSNEVLPNIEK